MRDRAGIRAADKLVADSLAAAAASGTPVDARLWLEHPPSYPTCLAVKSAAEQGDPGPYLRRLREGVMCRRRKLDTTEALVEEARLVPGLELERFRIDLGSHAILEAFGADLNSAASVALQHLAPGSDRVVLPPAELWRLASEWEVVAERVGSGSCGWWREVVA